MAEERGRHDHARVISAPKDLQVRSTGERRADPDNQLTWSSLRDRHAFDAHIFATVEHCGLHSGSAMMDRGFDRSAAVNDRALDGCASMMNRIFDRSATVLNRSFDRGTAMLDRSFNG
jgi:hypothetical protein